MSTPQDPLGSRYTRVSEGSAIRMEYAQRLSAMLGIKFKPGDPMPLLMGFILMKTIPHPDVPGAIGKVPILLLRSPGQIELHAARHIGPDDLLDVHHAVVNGRTHALTAQSDHLLNDDMTESGNTLLAVPPNPIGWALDRAAQRAGARCRQWRVKGGTEFWKALVQETRDAEAHWNMPPGTTRQVVTDLENPVGRNRKRWARTG